MSVEVARVASQSQAAPVGLAARQRAGNRGRQSPYETQAVARARQSAVQTWPPGAVAYGLHPGLLVEARSEQVAMEKTTPEAVEAWFRLSVVFLFVSLALSALCALSSNSIVGAAGAAAMAGFFLCIDKWLKTCA